jgi:hypothetical protein
MTAIDPRPVYKGSDLYNKLVNRILRGATRADSYGRRVNTSDSSRALYGPHAESIVKTCGQHARTAALVIEHLTGIVGWECHVIGHGHKAAEAALDHGVTMDGDDKEMDREDKLVSKLMRLALDLTDDGDPETVKTIAELERIARQAIRNAGKLAAGAIEMMPQFHHEKQFSPVNPDCVVEYFNVVIEANKQPWPEGF